MEVVIFLTVCLIGGASNMKPGIEALNAQEQLGPSKAANTKATLQRT